MCGITGFLDADAGTSRERLGDLVESMAGCLHHRGPDDSGVWIDAATGVALGHTRLAVIDLSHEGHQPMASADGRYVVVFNGEIYNFGELRADLSKSGARFRGHSDTEVLVEAIAGWGIDATLRRANGMFAFAVWDRTDRTLTLARDRVGEKPLYYGWLGRTFLFGSELKALRRHPAFDAEIDRDALALFLRHNYVPAPWSIYRAISKLRPGTALTVSPDRPGRGDEWVYWSAREIAEEGIRDQISTGEVVDRLDWTLRRAVKLRMVSDVPLGAFLSGGIDSSTVVALMQAQSPVPVLTFSIGFRESGFDEAGHAAAVARHLGTDHTEMYVTPHDALDVIPRIPEIYDEPFADSSQIPTTLLARLTRRHVTVALSGDGGDELFFGYDRYRWVRRLQRARRLAPGPARRALASMIERRSPEAWNRTIARGRRVMPGAVVNERFGDRLHTVARLTSSAEPLELYRQLMSHWPNPDSIVIGAREPATVLSDPAAWADLPGVDEQMPYLDLVSYLPDDILTKVDRATMAASLEARVPLLDPEVVALAWRIPTGVKVRHGRSKWVLREVLDRYVPRSLVERPKMGFGVPIAEWLRGPLREWGDDLLAADRLAREGFFRPEPVREAWERHQAGTAAAHYLLWDVLMFQAWLAAS